LHSIPLERLAIFKKSRPGRQKLQEPNEVAANQHSARHQGAIAKTDIVDSVL
jgi:hypothetical protein